MPKYGVYVTMVRTCVIEIEADNAKEAVKKVLAGEGEEFDSFGEEIVPPREFREAIEHRVRETDTYGHYLAKICGHPDLRLADGSQAVWLERRFTGGVVPVSTAQSALRLLSAALAASSTTGMTSRVKQAINILSSGVRNVGKVGCADLTGGVRMDFDKMQYYGDGNQQWAEVRLEVEIKVGDEPQRPEQVARMHSVRARGGCYVLARSVEDAVSQIKAFIKGARP